MIVGLVRYDQVGLGIRSIWARCVSPAQKCLRRRWSRHCPWLASSLLGLRRQCSRRLPFPFSSPRALVTLLCHAVRCLYPRYPSIPPLSNQLPHILDMSCSRNPPFTSGRRTPYLPPHVYTCQLFLLTVLTCCICTIARISSLLLNVDSLVVCLISWKPSLARTDSGFWGRE